MTPISNTDLIINPDGSIYHLHLRPDDISDTIIAVGDPQRVASISRHFDQVFLKKEYREFVTHRGTFQGKDLTVMSTGMGTDNIDIFLTELDALANIDFKTREVLDVPRSLKIVRVGTSGSIQKDVEVGTLLASAYGIGLDSLMCYYALEQTQFETQISTKLKDASNLPFTPYCVSCSKHLKEKLAFDMTIGNTATCPGFYAPQGRTVRAKNALPQLMHQLNEFRFEDFRITNLEMETAAYYALGRLLGHEILSLNAILANRVSDEFSTNPEAVINELIEKTLERI